MCCEELRPSSDCRGSFSSEEVDTCWVAFALVSCAFPSGVSDVLV